MSKRTWFASVMTTILASQTCFAQSGMLGVGDDVRASATTSEYVFRSTYRENLVPIQLLGAVNKPGLYFIPPRTDLVKLLTLAGGMQADAKDDIIIRKADQSWQKMNLEKGLRKEGNSYEVNMPEVLKKNDYTTLTMSAQDVVYVPAKEPFVSQDLYRTTAVVSLVMSIVLTGVLIDQRSKGYN